MEYFFQLLLLNPFTFIGIFLRIYALVLSVVFILPLQFKQSRVLNGLISLRKNLLLRSLLIPILGNIVSFVFVYTQVFTERSLQSDVASLINSSLFFISAYVDYEIYTHQYSDEHVAASNQVHRLIKRKQERDAGGIDKGV